MRLAALCFLLAAAALPARAQTQAPATSFSLQDDGAALNANPGGLAFVNGLEADFLHTGYYADGYNASDALLLSGGLGPLALGVGWDWVAGQTLTSVGGALRLGVLGLGTVHRAFPVAGHNVSSWDFGAIARPFSWLSLGAAVLQANRPSGFGRTWQVSVGLRPINDSLEVAGDFRWNECTNATGPCGPDAADGIVTGRFPITRGLQALAQVGFLSGATRTVLLGLQFDLPHAGVAYAPRVSPNSNFDAQNLWRLRVSTEPLPGVRLPISRAALVDLDKALERRRASPLALVFGETTRDPMAETTAALHRLADDRRVKAVVLRASSLSIGLGKAEELREAIQELQAKGKKVIFYLESAGDLEYSVASAADRIYAAPQAVLLVNGFSATALFAASGLDKLGVKAEFFRVGAYKNAPDLFTRSSMSGEQREVESSLLDDLYGRYLKVVADRRHLDEGKLKDLLDKGILKPSEAVDAGLLDGLLYPDQLEGEVGKLLGGRVSLERTSIEAEPVRDTHWGRRRKITVVRVEGEILRGEGSRGPLGAVEIAGSDPISRRIRRAADDPEVAAIVVRIDSPGGDGNASDLIWRELVRARKEKKKPVIASMGDVAASGGYYVAAGADEIWAEPSTVTGSIGVFIGHFDAEELFAKLGLNLTTVKRGASADLFSPARDLKDTERKTLQTWVESFYDQFVDRVSQARGLSKAEVDAVARGRIWTGAQAQARQLVDHLGGFDDAIWAAKKRANVSDDVEIDDEIESRVELSDFAGPGVLSAVPGNLGPRALRALRLLGEPGTVRAALPCDLEVR